MCQIETLNYAFERRIYNLNFSTKILHNGKIYYRKCYNNDEIIEN